MLSPNFSRITGGSMSLNSTIGTAQSSRKFVIRLIAFEEDIIRSISQTVYGSAAVQEPIVIVVEQHNVHIRKNVITKSQDH